MKIIENERLATVEQKISELKDDLSEVKSDVKEIKRCVLDSDLTRRVSRLEKKSDLWKFLSPTLAAILSSVMTFLIIQYLSHVK